LTTPSVTWWRRSRSSKRTDYSTAGTPWPVITTGIGKLVATVQIPGGR
jgi:hypothetical protein